MLHPPGIGVDLLKFPLRLRKDVPTLIEYNRPRACGALIQRHYILTQTDGLPCIINCKLRSPRSACAAPQHMCNSVAYVQLCSTEKKEQKTHPAKRE